MICDESYNSLLLVLAIHVTGLWVWVWWKIHAESCRRGLTAVVDLMMPCQAQPSEAMLFSLVAMGFTDAMSGVEMLRWET